MVQNAGVTTVLSRKRDVMPYSHYREVLKMYGVPERRQLLIFAPWLAHEQRGKTACHAFCPGCKQLPEKTALWLQ